MKKTFIPVFILTIIPITAMAAHNPMFGTGDENSISFYGAQGTGNGTLFKLVWPPLWEFEPATFLMLQYSQPITIFRLPARQNLNVAQNIGYGSNRGLSFFSVGISWDVSLVDWRGFYLGIGLGPYMRDSRDWCVDSRLVFGEKFFIGKNISDRWRAEFFTIHFSNGNLTPVNNGFNFTGLAVSYSF